MHRNFFLTQHQGRLVAALLHATLVGKTAVVKASKETDAVARARVLGSELVPLKSMEDARVLQAVSGASPDDVPTAVASSGAGTLAGAASQTSRFITPLVPVMCMLTPG